MSNVAILLPCAALVLLTLVVMLVMYSRRICEMRRERIAHSAIQVGRNLVLLRFRVLSAGAALLFALWIAFAGDLLRA